MTTHQSMEFDADQSSNDYEIMTQDSSVDDEDNGDDDEVDIEMDHTEDEDEQCSKWIAVS